MMKEAGLILKKKKFIDWFLQTYRLKSPDMARVLDFLRQNDEFLSRTRFVENVRHLPNALIISAQDAATVSFLCRLDGEYYESADEIIMELSYNFPDDFFVWLSFSREFMCTMCATVLDVEDDVRGKLFYHQVVQHLEKEINVTAFTRMERKAKILAEIDEALDDGDKERFFSLSAMYKEMFGIRQ